MSLEEKLGKIKLTESQFRKLKENLSKRYRDKKPSGPSYTAEDVKNLFRGTDIGRELGVEAIKEEIARVQSKRKILGKSRVIAVMGAAMLVVALTDIGLAALLYKENSERFSQLATSQSVVSQEGINNYRGLVIFAYEDNPLDNSSILKRFNELKEG